MPLSPAAAAFRSRIQVEPVPGSRLVNLHFRAYDPQVAADAVNTLGAALHRAVAGAALHDLDRGDGLALGPAQGAAGQGRGRGEGAPGVPRARGAREPGGAQGLVEQKLETLNGAVLDARTERIAKETLYNQIAIAGPGTDRELRARARERAGAGAEDRARLAPEGGGAARRDARRPAPRHGARARRRSGRPQEKIRAEIRNVARAAESEYRTALAQEARLAASLESVKGEAQDTNRKSIEYMVLQARGRDQPPALPGPAHEDQADRARDRAQDHEHPRGREGRDAARPDRPATRRATTSWRSSLGLLLGIGLALGFEHLDNTFKTPEDVKEHLGCRSWAWCPTWRSSRRPGARRPRPPSREEPELGGGRRLPRAAHEPDLLLGRDDAAAPSW